MWNALWYTQSGGTTGVVLLGDAMLMEPLQAELVVTTLEAELVDLQVEAILVEPLEAEVE